MRKFIGRHKYLLIFLLVLFLIGLFFGIILYFKQSDNSKSILTTNLTNLSEQLNNNHISNILPHLIILILIILLSLTIIGYLFGIFYLFYIATSISFSITFLTLNYGLNGLIFGLLYNILFKAIFLIGLIFILIKTSLISKNIFGMLVIKNNNPFKIDFKRNLIQILIMLSIILLNDILLYYLSSFTLKILTLML